ncbi:MAG: AAA family ATPase [Acidobacteriota bacterium]
MASRIPKFNRELKLSWVPNPVTGSAAAFLWGPRQTGKTTLLHQQFPTARFYDLLDSGLAAELSVQPRVFREQTLAERPELVVIDEIQKVPELLDEVHWLLENTSTRFALCGSSARKLRRRGRNLLGGRATEFRLLPLTSEEIPSLDLLRLLNHGALPIHYLVDDPAPLLRAYVSTYIKEEIIDEAATRNVPAFSRFLQLVGLTHGRQLNYANIAREANVSAATVRSYFRILDDTLLGFTLEPWRRTRHRRLVETAKFYLFDIGVANHLDPEAGTISEGSDLFGRAFEHFLLNEVRAFLAYRGKNRRLTFWRTSSGYEVDLIVGDLALALEFKSAKRVRHEDLRGMRALLDEHRPGRAIVVSCEERPRTTEDGIEIVAWRDFCKRLWHGELV